MPRNLRNVMKSQSASRLMFNKLIKNDQVIFSSEGQGKEVTDEEKLNIHPGLASEGTSVSPDRAAINSLSPPVLMHRLRLEKGWHFAAKSRKASDLLYVIHSE